MSPSFPNALFGGILIGLAAVLLLLTNGRIAGVSGILGGVLRKPSREIGWRFAFLGGLLCGGLAARMLGFFTFSPLGNRSLGALVAAGLLVGFGTQLGSGCTSGHGVCGIGRFSFRSILATITFIIAGAITVFIVNHIGAGL